MFIHDPAEHMFGNGQIDLLANWSRDFPENWLQSELKLAKEQSSGHVWLMG